MARLALDDAWRREAACRGQDPDVFFPASEDDEEPAKRVCSGCPVRRQCLDFAVTTRQTEGVWGGLGQREIRRVIRRRRGGR